MSFINEDIKKAFIEAIKVFKKPNVMILTSMTENLKDYPNSEKYNQIENEYLK